MARRILLFITDLQIGGTPTVVRELAVRLAREPAAQVEVASLAGWGPVAEELKNLGIAVTALGARWAIDSPAAVMKLVRLVRERRIDTVFSFLVHANAIAAAASRFVHRIRWIQSIQTTQPWPRWHWDVQGLIDGAAERIVVPSPSVAAAARRWAGIADEKLLVIPNAIEPGEFDGIARTSAGVKTIGFIGRLDRVKRIGDLIEAMPRLPGLNLEVFGEGAERAALTNLIDRLKLGNRVHLHGAVARPQEALAQFDLLVLPSEAEGFGLVLIEAMAADIPVVATNVAGIRDVVRDEETGLLVDVARPDQLAIAIARLRDDANLCARLVNNARADVIARFSWTNVIKQYRALLGI